MMRSRGVPIGHDVPMIRMLIRIGIALLGNALGLWVASLVLDDMSVSGTAFLIAVAIFLLAVKNRFAFFNKGTNAFAKIRADGAFAKGVGFGGQLAGQIPFRGAV